MGRSNIVAAGGGARVKGFLRAKRGGGVGPLEALESRVLLAATPTAFSRVISFTGQANGGGAHPNSLVMDGAGDIFGTTLTGGVHNYGTIFEVPAGTSTVEILASFPGGSAGGGYSPAGKLVVEGGHLYGTTTNGGALTRGTLFDLNLATHTLSTLASFGVNNGGSYPTSGIASDGAGNFYGTTYGASQQDATIFKYSLSTGALQTLVTLPLGEHIDTGVAADAGTGLVEILNAATVNGVTTGTIFATTTGAGGAGRGSIFSYALGIGATTVRTVASFDGTHGSGPIGSLLYVTNADAAGDAGLIGITTGGGGLGSGAVFDAPLAGSGGIYSSTLNLLGSLNGPAGARPLGNLLLVNSSNAATDSLLGNTLYGVTASGGGNGNGAVFKITGAAPVRNSAVVTALTRSAFTQQTGVNPSGGLVIGADGTLYGTTTNQGRFLNGTLFTLPAAVPAAGGEHLVFASLAAGAVAGVPLGATAAHPAGGVVVKIENAAGRVVADDSNVTLQVATPGGAFAPMTVAAVNGVANFANVTLTQSGPSTLLATDGAMSVQSNAITVVASPAARVAIVEQPSLGTTTHPGAVVVNVVDRFGNVVTGDHSKVTLTVVSGPGTVKGLTTVSAKRGVATFSALAFATAGTYTLKAADGALTGATTTAIAVGLPATHLEFTEMPPASVAEGAAFTVRVTLLDANGNAAATDTSLVRLMLGARPRKGALAGPASAAVIDGVATFAGLQVFAAGSYSLRAVDGRFMTTSSGFIVGAAV